MPATNASIRGPMPATRDSWKHEPFGEGVPIPYKATLLPAEFEQLKLGLIPEVMEDKWFIYFETPHLHLHRSWTGQPVYRVTFREAGQHVEAIEALFAVGSMQPGHDLNYHARLLDYLISTHLLGQSRTFPEPPGYRKRHWWKFWK
jgi:hypothetical protein